MSETRRYLGLELSGAKNSKTAIAALEYYPRERKIFLLDIFDKIAAHDRQTGDQALLEVIEELKPAVRVGVNVALELPPCVSCEKKTCPLPARCNVPAVKWMREATRKAQRGAGGIRVHDFTPYTQRPVELWVRYGVFPEIPESHRFEIDETLGGNRGPLSARMGFLKRHLEGLSLLEAWPKLTVALLAEQLGIARRLVTTYRHLDDGAHSREAILEILAKAHGVFIYERDVRKLSASLACFDAFICAYTALLSDLEDSCPRPPRGFPVASGWVYYPNRIRRAHGAHGK